jgi:hypothetical protein
MKVKLVPVHYRLSTRPWGCVREWVHRCTCLDVRGNLRDVISFRPRSLYPRRKKSRFPLARRWVCPEKAETLYYIYIYIYIYIYKTFHRPRDGCKHADIGNMAPRSLHPVEVPAISSFKVKCKPGMGEIFLSSVYQNTFPTLCLYLKMEPTYSCKELCSFYHSILRNFHQDSNLHSHRCEK